MKKLCLFLSGLFFVIALFAQADSVQAPYKRFPGYPPVKLLLPDSSSYYTKADLPKKKSVLLMLFNPDCGHCQLETEQMIAHIDAFKNVEVVMATNANFAAMKEFRVKYGLGRFDNIVVGQDTKYFLPPFYALRNFPFLAFYNRNKELVEVHEGSMPIEKLIELIKK
jgi:thiol-disulfide isomerase/thioredoxin